MQNNMRGSLEHRKGEHAFYFWTRNKHGIVTDLLCQLLPMSTWSMLQGSMQTRPISRSASVRVNSKFFSLFMFLITASPNGLTVHQLHVTIHGCCIQSLEGYD